MKGVGEGGRGNNRHRSGPIMFKVFFKRCSFIARDLSLSRTCTPLLSYYYKLYYYYHKKYFTVKRWRGPKWSIGPSPNSTFSLRQYLIYTYIQGRRALALLRALARNWIWPNFDLLGFCPRSLKDIFGKSWRDLTKKYIKFCGFKHSAQGRWWYYMVERRHV